MLTLQSQAQPSGLRGIRGNCTRHLPPASVQAVIFDAQSTCLGVIEGLHIRNGARLFIRVIANVLASASL